MAEFTPAQGRFLAYIQAMTQSTGRAPANSHIAAALGITPSSVTQMIKTLERNGLVRRQKGIAPSIEVLADPDSLPDWEQASPDSASTKTSGAEPNRAETTAAPAEGPGTGDIYRLKIVLLGTDPPIWRAIETRDVTLAELHRLIQIAMGWEDEHLHQFQVASELFMEDRVREHSFDGETAFDTAQTQLSSLVKRHGTRLVIHYEYDFGDSWLHQIRLTGMTTSDPQVQYPRCIAGERACPPEDIGGIHGYYNFLEQWENADEETRDELQEIYGSCDPQQFAAAKVTARMNRGRKQR